MLKITLRAARESCGFTIEEVTKHCGVSVNSLRDFEVDSEWMPINIIAKILDMYKASSSLIYFGTGDNCVNYNRDRITSG